MLLKAGFEMLRSKGSHRIYAKDNRRIVIPFHSGKILHPKIVKQVIQRIKNSE
jgi:predicted RNA binding protein YcfA (HicA-like mRNA interferase family)